MRPFETIPFLFFPTDSKIVEDDQNSWTATFSKRVFAKLNNCFCGSIPFWKRGRTVQKRWKIQCSSGGDRLNTSHDIALKTPRHERQWNSHFRDERN